MKVEIGCIIAIPGRQGERPDRNVYLVDNDGDYLMDGEAYLTDRTAS